MTKPKKTKLVHRGFVITLDHPANYGYTVFQNLRDSGLIPIAVVDMRPEAIQEILDNALFAALEWGSPISRESNIELVLEIIQSVFGPLPKKGRK